MPERRGTVWYGNRRVGVLREDENLTLQFAYDPEWLDHDGFPISVHLPLANGDRETAAHSFFEGLLPEGRVRQRICRRLGIDIRDDAGLLLAIGEDCAGALSILPMDTMPVAERRPPESLSAESFREMVRSLGTDVPGLVGQQRFSLAGAQEKQPVIYDGAGYALPDHANPSSHILKFETVPRVCFAEFAANDAARRIGLPVVTTEYLPGETGNDAPPYLRIARFDRARNEPGQPLQRLHQEDIIQALGGFSTLKYQRDGGPSLKDVATLLRENTASPVETLARLRDWQIFNCLAGNWDGHGKNLALLYKSGEATPGLAPFYDLVAIEFLNLVKPGTYAREMAFAIGAQDAPERITRADWEKFSRDLGMPPKRVLARLEELAHQLPTIANETTIAFAETFYDNDVYRKFVESISRRCEWTLKSVFLNR